LKFMLSNTIESWFMIVAKQKVPMSCKVAQKICSSLLLPEMSP
jgi:hypothetical protein